MLAYWFTLNRAVPVKVIATYGTDADRQYVVKVTAMRGPYERGEIHHVGHLHLAARPCHRSLQHIGRIYSRALTAAEIATLPVASFASPNVARS